MQQPPMSAEEQRQMQEKFNRIINRMIERLDQPLSTSEYAIQRMNGRLQLPSETTSTPVAPNASAQVIYETVAKAERLNNALLRIERELADRTWQQQNPGQAPPSQYSNAPMLTPMATAPEVSKKPGPAIPLVNYNPVEKVDNLDDFTDQSRQKGVDYTVMGVTTTKPMHNVTREPVDEYDESQRQRAVVTPWNQKLPITFSVNIAKKRWFVGENLVFDIEVLNEGTKNIKKLTLHLFKRKEQYALRQANLKMDLKKELVVHELEVIPHGFPIPARKRHKGKVNFKLPYSLEPTQVGPSKGWIYYVQVMAGVPRHGGPAVILGPMAFEQRVL